MVAGRNDALMSGRQPARVRPAPDDQGRRRARRGLVQDRQPGDERDTHVNRACARRSRRRWSRSAIARTAPRARCARAGLTRSRCSAAASDEPAPGERAQFPEYLGEVIAGCAQACRPAGFHLVLELLTYGDRRKAAAVAGALLDDLAPDGVVLALPCAICAGCWICSSSAPSPTSG
jgi:hypothetical protein